ncbi:M28 family peptidase [Cerasicoccus fimbriatus]|uniref:M28 family peptidase n=1 Tax=Cerasicoccus fimbriatus TaxID=3014554 RepID=UPI0022B42A66|nr:M28 family peptidase [Cerasicoccus sp. TK19100]
MAKSWLRALSKALFRIVIVVGLFLAATWYVIAQPVWTHQPAATLTADPVKLRQHVEKLAVDFHPRNFTEVENLNACADYIAAQFKAASGQVREQTFTVQGNDYRNVSAFFGPANGPLWIVGAHYDTCEDTPGADDNASGVAGLLELARLLGENPPSVPIELVAYPLEEPPFFSSQSMGSAHHANALDLATEPVLGVIVLEMIGYYSDAPGSQEHPSKLLEFVYPSTGNFLAVVGNWEQRGFVKQVKGHLQGVTDLPIESIAAPPVVPGIDFSDHRNYWPLGVNAVMVTDTAFYRNKNYHRATDTPDTLDYERMAMAVTAVNSALGSMASKK